MQLSLKPNYPHSKVREAPHTILIATSSETKDIYDKLKSFLAIKSEYHDPSDGWDSRYRRDLFVPGGFHFHVEWSGKLNPEWRRLTFEEFISWYNIPIC